MDPSLVVPTFRNPRTFPRTLSDPWGRGVTGTEYYLQDGMVREITRFQPIYHQT